MYKSRVMPKRHLMMHKTLTDLSLDNLEQCTLDKLQAHRVTAVLLALGSNYQAQKYLPIARTRLAELGEMQLSTAFQNPDFTATLELPKPDYTNQCVYLSLKTPMTLQQLEQMLKQFEEECHRQRSIEKQTLIKKVTIDIDVLLVNLQIVKNSLSNNKKSKWVIIKDRYPFKAHETAGIKELFINDFLTD